MPSVRWPVLAAIPPAVAAAMTRRRTGLPQPVSVAVTAAVPLLVAAGMPRSRLRHALVWAAQMWAYKTQFEIPYDRPERLRRRLVVDMPLRVDEAIGRGTAPTQRLQARLRQPGAVNAVDRALTALYITWEAEPHVALALLLALRPERFGALAARQAATFDVSIVNYWLRPAAPPWWAAEEARRMDGQVERVATRVSRDLRDEPLEQNDVEGANPWGSFPSNHFATALAAAFTLAEVRPALGAAGLGYALALGFALVYLGEHYVVDLLAGAAVALGVAALEPALAPAGRRLDRAWRAIEPSP